MMFSLILASLFASTAAAQEITPLDNGRFKVTVVFYGSSANAHADALLALAAAAREACKGKGNAVSEGVLEVNEAPPNARGRKGLSVGEVYRCVPKAG